MNNTPLNPHLRQANVSGCPLDKARSIALQIVDRLQPYCDKIQIAGSVRREKVFVKDIEIVALPTKVISEDIFGNALYKTITTGWRNEVCQIGKIIKGKIDGKYIQIELPEGLNLDLFMPDENDYYRQLAIRTGSADYSFKVIATAWKKLGWCGSDVGLRKMSDCIETKTPDGKSKWKCVKQDAELPPVWKSEEDFFNWINVKMLKPCDRVV
jgi:DNA polymerase/3'-5' exonuclease PolX